MSTIAVKKVKLGDNADTSKNLLIEVPAVADGTLTIKRENGTAVLSIDANGKAVIPGVVGAVAQVGGIPTGQVVERGSNANGEYVRFADGTQICTRNGVSIPAPTSLEGGVYVGGSSIVLTFSANFSGNPAVVAFVDGGMAFAGVTIGNEASTSSTFSARSWRSTSFAADPTMSFVAVGRWF